MHAHLRRPRCDSFTEKGHPGATTCSSPHLMGSVLISSRARTGLATLQVGPSRTLEPPNVEVVQSEDIPIVNIERVHSSLADTRLRYIRPRFNGRTGMRCVQWHFLYQDLQLVFLIVSRILIVPLDSIVHASTIIPSLSIAPSLEGLCITYRKPREQRSFPPFPID
ncbi:hypothetical protein BO71DRAFT_428835 [Aspergillus ellipticus CBS 707.79]|uniref:Uncharacterized protein n=1 Tax=Aspergillus ellipticus CBS 707.79 TaxID=1448320 RepID=A0A319DEA7_9EURO|nr:hypothetical protein BO71DRAFT_428835 [Aspergillus ellipticus CBS 707.79]